MYKEFDMKNHGHPVKRVQDEVIKPLNRDPLIRSLLSFKKVLTTLTLILALMKKAKSLFRLLSETDVQNPEKMAMLEPI
jgi:hypothetical protein